MLTIVVSSEEYFDDAKGEFITPEPIGILQLEHSLVSISKWEAKWHKAFLGKTDKTEEETMYYVKCMTINRNVSDEVYNRLSKDNVDEIKAYIDDSMTATWFPEDNTPSKNSEVITSELIYYWMVAMQIPFECQKWHLNRLLTLIQVCDRKNRPPKKLSRNEILRKNAEINRKRREALGSKG